MEEQMRLVEMMRKGDEEWRPNTTPETIKGKKEKGQKPNEERKKKEKTKTSSHKEVCK